MDNNRDKTVILQEKDTEARASSVGPIVAIIAVIVLILVAILGYNLLTGNDNATETNTTNTTTNNEVTSPVEEGADLTNPDPTPAE